MSGGGFTNAGGGNKRCLNSEMLWRTSEVYTVFMNQTSEHIAYFMECMRMGPWDFLGIVFRKEDFSGVFVLRVLDEPDPGGACG